MLIPAPIFLLPIIKMENATNDVPVIINATGTLSVVLKRPIPADASLATPNLLSFNDGARNQVGGYVK